MPFKILTDNWSEYDNRKRGYNNVSYIDCTIEWEAESLAQKVFKAYPDYKLDLIRNAIAGCCRNLPVPYKRVSFVASLMIILRGSNSHLLEKHDKCVSDVKVKIQEENRDIL